MKLKLDENLSFRIARALGELGHDVHTVGQEGLTGVPDSELWLAAQSEKRFLITQDMEFSDGRKYPAGSHAGVLLVRMPHATRLDLAARVVDLFETENVDEWVGCLVIASERKLRVKKTAKPQFGRKP